MNYAIIAYPLSNDFSTKIQRLVGAPLSYLPISELRKLSIFGLIKKLRSVNAVTIFIPIEDHHSLTLLPILKIIGFFTKTNKIQIIYPDLTLKIVTRIQLFSIIYQLFLTSFASCTATFQVLFHSKKLIHKNPKQLQYSTDNSAIIYLNANLWFGVKAGGSVGHIAGVINAFSKNISNIYYASIDNNLQINPSVNFVAVNPLKTYGIPAELNHYRLNLDIIKQLSKKIKKIPFKFIYQRLSLANYSGVILARKLQIPLIIEYNGSEVWAAKNWGKALRFSKLALMCEDVCLRHATLIVTISKVLRDELITRGVDPQKIVFYPNCIDPKIFNPQRFSAADKITLREFYQIDKNAIVLTFLGTFGAWHGVEYLARTIRLMIDTQEDWLIQHKVHFLLIGDGVKMLDVRAILNDKKYRPYITFTGIVPQPEAPAYLAASDILLSPHIANADGSKFFGSPTKLFEYMAMGKGIIASDLEQIGEVLNHSLQADHLPDYFPNDETTELAVLTKPGNIEELIKGIVFLVEQPSWREKLGVNARKEALGKYTWDQHVDAILKKIDEISL